MTRSDSLRILMYVDYLDTARRGPVRATVELAAALANHGHQVIMLTRDDRDAPPSTSGLPAQAGPGKLVAVRLPPGDGFYGRFNAEQLKVAQACVVLSDVAHFHGMWRLDQIQIADAMIARRKHYVVSPRGMLDEWCMTLKSFRKRVYMNVLGSRQLERSLAVHCTAAGERTQIQRWTGRARVMVLPNFIDLEPFRASIGSDIAIKNFPYLGSPDFRILFLARIHPPRGVDVLVRAASELKRRGLKFVLTVAGTGDSDYVAQLQRLCHELGVDDRIEFIGHVGGSLKVSLLRAHDVLAMPTEMENFGFVYPEALAAGLPIVTTKGLDLWPELLESGGASIVDRTPIAFANELFRLATDASTRDRMSVHAREYAMREFDESRVVAGYERMYRGETPNREVAP